MVEVTEQKASWVNVTVTGDPEVARAVKAFLGLVLDWTVLTEKQFLTLRKHLKIYDQTSALKSTDRLTFYVVRHVEMSKAEKAGFRTEEKRG